MRQLILSAGLLLLAAYTGSAENRALLIGVGKYQNFPDKSLDGPPYDVAELERSLGQQWGFTDIHKLVDEQATAAAIRRELIALGQRVKAGDHIFIYFSGHGTSAYDPKMSSFCADVASGCVIPYDVKGGTPQEVMGSILLGRRDFRPVLNEIERRKPGSVLVAFDACYSENSAKSVANARGTTRELPLSSMVKSGATEDDYDAAYKQIRPKDLEAAAKEAYPYQQVVFMSASAKDEKAHDIAKWMIDQKQAQTLDNKPHGRMTDAFLRGLRGDADQNHDGRVSYRELHDFTLKMMRGVQNPQIQMPNPAIGDEPVFGVLKAPSSPRLEASRSGLVHVRLDPSAADLAPSFAGMKSVEVRADGQVDFSISRMAGSYILALDSGLEVRRYAATEKGILLARIAAEPRVRKLMDWSYPQQEFNASLAFQPEGRGVYHVGEELMFKMSADRASFYLLVNIDTTGMVTVVFPVLPSPPSKTAASVRARSAETGGAIAGPETGAEYMKLFAFSGESSDTGRWAGASFESSSPQFDELLKFVDRAGGAETALVFFSAPR